MPSTRFVPLLSVLVLAVGRCVSAPAQVSSPADLTQLGDYQSQRASSYDRAGTNHDYESLPTGKTLTIFAENGPAEIRHIWITMATGEAHHLKKLVLRMYWDEEATPSVETPIGDFFGLGLGTYTNYQSALLNVSPDKGLNSYLRMPFVRNGRITVTNEGTQDVTDFYWNIDWVKVHALLPNSVYFHAQYHQCTPCQGWYKGNFYSNDFAEARRDSRWKNVSGEGNYTILEASGDGHFVGNALSLPEPMGRLERRR